MKPPRLCCLVLGAILLSCFWPLSLRANVYATDIRVNGAGQAAGILLSGSNLTVSYILNDNATAGVWVHIYSGTNLIETLSSANDDAGTNAGLNTATWSAPNLPVGVYTVSITAASTGYSTWTNITDDGPNFSVQSPTGLTVNQNTNSPYYGRVFVANSDTPFGIYKFNADGSPGDEGGFSTGGLSWGGYLSYSPWKMANSQDDNLYIDDFSGNGVVYKFGQTIDPNQSQVALGPNNYPPYPPGDGNPQFSGLAVSGSGTNTQIWMADENPGPFGPSGQSDGILCWNAATNGVAADSDTGSTVATANTEYLTRPYDLALDRKGNIYTIQFLTPSDNPGYELMSFPPFTGLTETGPTWAISMYPALLEAYGVAVDPTGSYVAVAVVGTNQVEDIPTGGIFLYKAANGDFIADIDHTGGDAYYDVAWDNVGNLYAADATAEMWRAYSPPGTNQSTTVAVPIIQSYQSLTPPSLVNPTVGTNNNLRFTLQGQSNVTYVVQASCDLVNWSPVKTNYSPHDNRSICLPAVANQKFFRAVTTLTP